MNAMNRTFDLCVLKLQKKICELSWLSAAFVLSVYFVKKEKK